MRSLKPRSPLIVGLVTVLASVTMSSVPAGAAPVKVDPASEAKRLGSEREQVRAQRASKATQINALRADDDKVSAALSDLSKNVSSQQDLLLEAQNGVRDSERQAKEAEQRAKEAGTKLGSLRDGLADRAAQAFVTMPSHSFGAASEDSSPNQLMTRRTYLNLVAGNDRTQVEDLRATEQDLTTAKASAKSASERAQARRAEVSSRLAKLQQAAQLKAAGEAQRSGGGGSSAPSGGGGGGGGGGAPVGITGSGSIVSVGGIRVHQSIAGNLSQMLGAARASGINLGGGGFRDPADQVRVRRSNCGSSSYSIYQAPSSSCRPPTAIPGTSQHERGLAIDFTSGGSALSSGGSGYSWLKANASRYGFHNLPGEPWHWSTTGS